MNGLYETFPNIDGVPLVYYIGLFGDACVPIYCFASGYGLFVIFNKGEKSNIKKNLFRIFKLLINYWVVLVLFVLIGFMAGFGELYPGSLSKFLMNFFVISSSYNGAWWFMQTYIILVLVSPMLFKFAKKYSSLNVLFISGVIYLVSYVQRIKQVFDFSDYTFLNMAVNSLVLVGTSFLPFIVGSIFAKEKIYTKVYNKFHNISFKNTICLIGILLLVVIHSLYESLIIAPITATGFICLFNLMNKNNFAQKVLNFFGNHSTNIWLTHVFFYLTIFRDIIFAPKYPVLIFIWLLSLCIISSYVINFIHKPIIRAIDKNQLNLPKEYKIINAQKTN